MPAWVYLGPTPDPRPPDGGHLSGRAVSGNTSPATLSGGTKPRRRPGSGHQVPEQPSKVDGSLIQARAVPPKISVPRRILAVKLADVGDTLLVTPALSALRHHFPDSDLDALVTPTGAQVLRRSSLTTELLEFEPRRPDRGRAVPGPAVALEMSRSLRGRKYDMVILFHHLTTRTGAVKHAALVMSTGAPVRAGLALEGSSRGFFLTHRAADLGFDGAHEVEAALSIAAAVGAEPVTEQLDFSPGLEAERRAAELLAERPVTQGTVGRTGYDLGTEAGNRAVIVRHVAIHAGTGPYSPARRWPAAYFAAVAAEVSSRGFEPVLVGTAGDGVADVVRRLTVPVLDLTGRTDLATLGAVLARCSAAVCNDGGVMHLATAVGTPTVAVFGPSNPTAWGPWPRGPESPHRVVALNISCRPCFYVEHRLGARNGCPTRDCLAWLKPEWVVRGLDEVLASKRPGPLTDLSAREADYVDDAPQGSGRTSRPL